MVPLLTVYRGPKARQPRALLVGEGVVHVNREHDVIIIHP